MSGSRGLAENVEYPFFKPVKTEGNWTIEIRQPNLSFERSDTDDHFNTARALLELIEKLYPDLNVGDIDLPPPL